MEKGEEERPESSRVAGRPGRPRIERSNDTAMQTRRKQIRDAQRTYRLKKEAKAQALEARCEELELKTKHMMEAFSKIYETASLSGLESSNPELATLIQGAASHFGIKGTEFSNDLQGSDEADADAELTGYDNVNLPSSGHNQLSNADPGDSIYAFGYNVPQSRAENIPGLNPETISEIATTPIAPSQDNFWNPQAIENYISSQTLLGGESQARLNNTVHTYSFLETNFARRIHRNCLEYFYRIFDDPAADPTSVYRVFRLVACIQDRAKMKPYFQNLLRRPAGGSIEISGQPFYCIGGAGKHYPRKDDVGTPIYPSNMRLPKRILGFVSNNKMAMMSPFVDEGYEEFLCQRGYGGEWFDPQDVEGYLCSKGILLNAQSSIVKVLRHDAPASIIQSPLSSGAAVSPDTDESRGSASNPPCIFDADYFLDCLCRKGIVLGRVPGFRKADVDQALVRSLRYSVSVF